MAHGGHFLLAVLLILTACGSNKPVANASDKAAAAVNKGSAAPMFDLKDVNGSEVSLASLAGQKYM